jgi:hypothetical protein
LYQDSTSNAKVQWLYIQKANANCSIFISLKPMATEKTILEVLLEKKTQNQLGPNDAHHHSFLDTVKEQHK